MVTRTVNIFTNQHYETYFQKSFYICDIKRTTFKSTFKD